MYTFTFQRWKIIIRLVRIRVYNISILQESILATHALRSLSMWITIFDTHDDDTIFTQCRLHGNALHIQERKIRVWSVILSQKRIEKDSKTLLILIRERYGFNGHPLLPRFFFLCLSLSYLLSFLQPFKIITIRRRALTISPRATKWKPTDAESSVTYYNY